VEPSTVAASAVVSDVEMWGLPPVAAAFNESLRFQDANGAVDFDLVAFPRVVDAAALPTWLVHDDLKPRCKEWLIDARDIVHTVAGCLEAKGVVVAKDYSDGMDICVVCTDVCYLCRMAIQTEPWLALGCQHKIHAACAVNCIEHAVSTCGLCGASLVFKPGSFLSRIHQQWNLLGEHDVGRLALLSILNRYWAPLNEENQRVEAAAVHALTPIIPPVRSRSAEMYDGFSW